MNITPTTYAQSDIDFLIENFVQLDISTGKTTQQVPDIVNARVILIGESHYSSHLQKIHAQFLQRFATDSSCLLIEGVSPGVELHQSQVAQYSMYPSNLKIFGSDIRSYNETAEKSAIFINKMFEFSQGIEDFIDQIQTLASYINQLIEEGRLQLFKDGVLAQEELALEIRNRYFRISHDLDKKRDTFTNVCSVGNSQMNLRKSDKELMAQITQKSEQFEKIFAIWGAAHFAMDREFHEALTQLHSSVVVLLPSQHTLLRTSFHSKYAQKCYKLTWLNFYISDDHIRRSPFPSGLISFFHPLIQKIFTINKSKRITFSPDELLSYLSDKQDTLHIDCNTQLRIRGIDLASFEYLSVPHEENQCATVITHMLNNWLSLSKARFSSFDGAISKWALSIKNYELCITFTFSKPAKWVVKKEVTGADSSSLFY